MSERPNSHPGEVLMGEYLKPINLRQNRLAREIGVPQRRIKKVCLGQRAVTADAVC